MGAEEYELRRNKPEFKEQDSMGGENPFGGANTPDPYAGSFGGFPQAPESSGGGSPFGSFPEAPTGGGGGAFGGFPEAPGLGGGGNGTPGGFGSPDPFGGLGPMGAPGQQQPPARRSGEEIATDLAVKAGSATAKATLKSSKAVFNSVKESNAKIWARAATRTMWYGLITGGVLLIVQLFGWMYGMKQSVLMPFAGVVLGGGVISMLIWALNYEKAKKIAGEPETPEAEELPDLGSMMDQAYAAEPAEYEYEEDDEEEDLLDIDEDEGSWYDEEEDDESDEEIEADINEVLENMPEITPGTQTRSFLVEQYRKVLTAFSPGFNTWEVYDEGDQVCVDYEEYLKDACLSNGVKYDNVPMVEEVRENAFIIEVKARRQEGPKLNLDLIASELANVYAANEAIDQETGLPDTGVYAVYRSAGMTINFRIYKAKAKLVVGIGDAYRTDLDFVNDPEVKMPVIVGIGENANVIKIDFSTIYSMLISGKPRKGKSVEAKAILLQIAMYNSPREVHYHIIDSKNESSDYYNMNIPHIKSFAGTVKDIIKTLEWVVNVEGPRRKKVFGAAKEYNYNDYMAKNPEAIDDMPRMYLIMDEMGPTFLAADKDEKSTLRSLITTVILQYPGMGIYFVGIPHRVTQEMIPKSASDNVAFNIAFAASPDEIEGAMSTKPKDFPYLIDGKVGESAVKVESVNGGKTTYMRGIVAHLDKSRMDQIVDFVRSVWHKLDHEYYHGPRIDFHDKGNGIFDDYSCGMKSRSGGMPGFGRSSSAGDSGAGAASNQRPLLGRMNGGFVEPSVENGRTDGKGVKDVFDTEGFDDDDLGEQAFNSLIK